MPGPPAMAWLAEQGGAGPAHLADHGQREQAALAVQRLFLGPSRRSPASH